MFLAADAACRQRLARQGIDLRAYDSAADAADLNDLRIALGYRRWNLFAVSADGVVALTTMRLYPDGLRSVALDSPVGNQWQMRGPDLVRTANRMLEKVFAGCAANAACNQAYPNLRARFFERVHSLRRHPVVVNTPLDGTAPFPIVFDGDLVLNMGYCFDPDCAGSSPRVLDEAARGDLAAYAADVFGSPLTPLPPSDPVLSEGKTTIFRCRDYIAFEPDSELLTTARELPDSRGTLLTLRFISVPTLTKQACDRWQVGRANPAQHEPVRSPIPTLRLTGEWDGEIGPPAQRLVASYLPNSFSFVFPGIGHFTTTWSDCPGVILGEFLDTPTPSPTRAASPPCLRWTSTTPSPPRRKPTRSRAARSSCRLPAECCLSANKSGLDAPPQVSERTPQRHRRLCFSPDDPRSRRIKPVVRTACPCSRSDNETSISTSTGPSLLCAELRGARARAPRTL